MVHTLMRIGKHLVLCPDALRKPHRYLWHLVKTVEHTIYIIAQPSNSIQIK